MIESDFTPRRPKRRVDSLEIERKARADLAPINEKLGPWQMELARLAEEGRRARGAVARARAAAAVRELLLAVARESEVLAEAVGTGGEPMLRSTRVSDTRRALESIRARAESILQELEG